MLPGASPTNGIARVVFWLIFVFFLFSAIGALKIPAVTGFMNQVLAYLPNVIVAIFIFVIAALLAGAVAGGVAKVMGDTPTGKIVATIVPALVMVIAMFMILDQLKIAPQIVQIAFAATMGALALGLALAFGLGGRASRSGCSRTPTARAASRRTRSATTWRPVARGPAPTPTRRAPRSRSSPTTSTRPAPPARSEPQARRSPRRADARRGPRCQISCLSESGSGQKTRRREPPIGTRFRIRPTTIRMMPIVTRIFREATSRPRIEQDHAEDNHSGLLQVGGSNIPQFPRAAGSMRATRGFSRRPSRWARRCGWRSAPRTRRARRGPGPSGSAVEQLLRLAGAGRGRSARASSIAGCSRSRSSASACSASSVEVAGEQLEQPGVGRVGRTAGPAAPAASARPRAGRCRASCRTRRTSLATSRMSSESWKAIADLLAVRRERLLDLERGAGEPGAVPRGGRDQRAGLARDDPQVVRERVLVGPGLERLEDLALDELGERLGLDPHRVRRPASAVSSEDFGEQEVAGEDRDVVVPAGVRRLGARGAASASSITSSW